MKIKLQKSPDIKLVVTAALKKEVPGDWFVTHGIPVHTIEALKSGAIKQQSFSSGILIVITGPGPDANEDAARWIRDHVGPLFVVNIGTCGLLKREYPVARWIRPRYSANEGGDTLKLDMRLPFPFEEDAVEVHSLLSVGKTCNGAFPDAWKRHDAIDMECYSQAKIFSECGISFHCLKFSTDFSDGNMLSDFNANLALFARKLTGLFSFTEDNPSRITAVIPVHNRQQTIGRAIDSVLSQSHRPDEIIVVDDCSDDKTKDVLRSYYEKITPVFLSRNSGPSPARNEGVKRAKTEWVAFLDSDDCWEKDKLKDQVEYLGKYPFYRILQSEEVWIRNGARVNPCRHHKKPEGWIWEKSLERCLVSPSGVLVRKSLLEQYGLFDEGLSVCEDYDLWLKISRRHPVGLEPSFSVIKYGGHSDQLSRRYPAMDRFRVRSLMRLLEQEPDGHYREKIIRVLAKKLTILINGYEKRGKRNEAEECRGMLESLRKM